MKELFLYDGFYSFTIENLISQMKDVGDDSDITIRINSGGGSVFAGWGLIGEMQKRKGKTTIAVDGNASSMGFITTLFADSVKILSTTKFGVHRAEMYVETEEEKKMLNEQNASIRSAFESRLNESEFTRITGKTFEQIFTETPRPTVWLSAEDAVAIGLVKSEDVLVLTPALAAEISNKITLSMGAYSEPENNTNELNNNNNNNNTEKTMDANEIQAVEQKAAEKELARVNAWMVFADVDLAKVKAGIESGKEISAKEMGEFVLAQANKKNLDAIEAASPEAVKTPEEIETEAKTQYEQEKAELEAALGLK